MHKFNTSNIQTFVFVALAVLVVAFILPIVYDKDFSLNLITASFLSFVLLLGASAAFQKKAPAIVYSSICLAMALLTMIGADFLIYIFGFADKFVIKTTMVRFLTVDTMMFFAINLLYIKPAEIKEIVAIPNKKEPQDIEVKQVKPQPQKSRIANKLNEVFYQKNLVINIFESTDLIGTKFNNLNNLLISTNDAINLVETNALIQHIGHVNSKIKIISQMHIKKLDDILMEIRQRIPNLNGYLILSASGEMLFNQGFPQVPCLTEIAFGINYINNYYYFNFSESDSCKQIILKTPEFFYTVEIMNDLFVIYKTDTLEGIISHSTENEIKRESQKCESSNISTVSIRNFQLLLNKALDTLITEAIFQQQSNYLYYSFENNCSFSKNNNEKMLELGEKITEVVC